MDFERRKRLMESNYFKRNVFIKRVMQAYERDYAEYRLRKAKLTEGKRKGSGTDIRKDDKAL